MSSRRSVAQLRSGAPTTDAEPLGMVKMNSSATMIWEKQRHDDARYLWEISSKNLWDPWNIYGIHEISMGSMKYLWDLWNIYGIYEISTKYLLNISVGYHPKHWWAFQLIVILFDWNWKIWMHVYVIYTGQLGCQSGDPRNAELSKGPNVANVNISVDPPNSRVQWK